MLAIAALPYIFTVASLILAAVLLASIPSPAVRRDDRPDQSASQDVPVPTIYGRMPVPPIVCWIQPDSSATFSGFLGGSGSLYGKGFGAKSGSGQDYEEAAWHVLCKAGGAKALHSIEQNGTTIFVGPITPKSHPSGTAVSCGSEGDFVIYWGEDDQPINSVLAAASNCGVASRWNGVVSILWNKKKLGKSPVWGKLTYTLECIPVSTELMSTSPLMPSSANDFAPLWLPNTPAQTTGTRVDVRVITCTGGDENNPQKFIKIWNQLGGFGSPSVTGVDLRPYFAGRICKLWGTGTGQYNGQLTDFSGDPDVFQGGAGDPIYYFVDHVTYDPAEIIFDAGNSLYYKGITTVYLGNRCTIPVGTRVVANPSVFTASPCDIDNNDGVNPAFILDELIFAEEPDGKAMPRSMVDMNSLEVVARTCLVEGLRGHMMITDFEELESAVAAILMDIGCCFRWEPRIGKYQFQVIREPAPSLPTISKDLLADPLPEIDTYHGELVADDVSYSFIDRLRNYRETPVTYKSDGVATYTGSSNPKTTLLRITTNADAAQVIAQRRRQEVFAKPAKIKVKALRNARLLSPGQHVNVEGFDVPFLVMQSKPNVLTSEVELELAVDTYGVVAFGQSGGSFVPPQFGGQPEGQIEPGPDLEFAILEAPRLLSGGTMGVVAPRLRQGPHILLADLFLSRDGASYNPAAVLATPWSGGCLTATLSQDSFYLLEDGPTFTTSNSDMGLVENLTGSEASWLSGRQIAIIGEELFYLRGVENLGNNNYKLKGLLRARLGTKKVAHNPGTPVYICRSHEIDLVRSAALVPGVALYAKSQPYTASAGLDLAEAAPSSIVLRGDALRPLAPGSLRTSTLSPSFPAGASLVLKWCYYNFDAKWAGAGMSPAGTATPAVPVPGIFLVEIVSGVTVVRSTTTTSPTFTYSFAERVADFGLDPASFTVRVSHIENGFTSEASSLALVKV